MARAKKQQPATDASGTWRGELESGESDPAPAAQAVSGSIPVSERVLGPLAADEVVVVSGLPRSGTLMLMQMLAAGGMPMLTDHQRAADEDNPRGYFELEAVRKGPPDLSWVAQARGKAVKVHFGVG